MVQLGADLVVLAVAVLPDGDATGDVGRAERNKEKPSWIGSHSSHFLYSIVDIDGICSITCGICYHI